MGVVEMNINKIIKELDGYIPNSHIIRLHQTRLEWAISQYLISTTSANKGLVKMAYMEWKQLI